MREDSKSYVVFAVLMLIGSGISLWTLWHWDLYFIFHRVSWWDWDGILWVITEDIKSWGRVAYGSYLVLILVQLITCGGIIFGGSGRLISRLATVLLILNIFVVIALFMYICQQPSIEEEIKNGVMVFPVTVVGVAVKAMFKIAAREPAEQEKSIADYYAQGEAMGWEQEILESILEGDYSLERGAEKLRLPVEAVRQKLEQMQSAGNDQTK